MAWYLKGHTPWNKGVKGLHLSRNTEFKKGRIAPNKKEPIVRPCLNCGKIITTKQSLKRVKYCSRSCVRKGKPSLRKGIKMTDEQKAKLSLAHKTWKDRHPGKLHWNWIEDRTLLVDDHKDRGGAFHRNWSKEVKKRDGWKCKIADEKCAGRVEAHHILSWKEYPELRYKLNNGITLCHAHHPRRKADEAKLSPYFQKLVAEMK